MSPCKQYTRDSSEWCIAFVAPLAPANMDLDRMVCVRLDALTAVLAAASPEERIGMSKMQSKALITMLDRAEAQVKNCKCADLKDAASRWLDGINAIDTLRVEDSAAIIDAVLSLLQCEHGKGKVSRTLQDYRSLLSFMSDREWTSRLWFQFDL